MDAAVLGLTRTAITTGGFDLGSLISSLLHRRTPASIGVYRRPLSRQADLITNPMLHPCWPGLLLNGFATRRLSFGAAGGQVSEPSRTPSVDPAVEKLLGVGAEPRIGGGRVGEHCDDAGPGPGDGGDTVRAVVPAEQGECASSAAHRTNARAVALDQAAHTLQVLVICAAQHRHVLELTPAERR